MESFVSEALKETHCLTGQNPALSHHLSSLVKQCSSWCVLGLEVRDLNASPDAVPLTCCVIFIKSLHRYVYLFLPLRFVSFVYLDYKLFDLGDVFYYVHVYRLAQWHPGLRAPCILP